MAETWLREQAAIARMEHVYELSLQVREELQMRQRNETEAAAVRDHALKVRALRFGLVLRTAQDLERVRTAGLFWPANSQKHHHCSSESCEIFNIPFNVHIPQFDNPAGFIVSTGAWYVCMETGKMHECLPGNMCSSMKIVKDKEVGVTAAYSCVISNLLKPVPKSSSSAWNGTTFYSRGVLRDIENRQDNAEFDEIGGYDDSELEEDEDLAESLISDDQSDAEEAGADEPDELQDEEDEQTAKRQRIDMAHVNNDATPFSTIQARYSTSLGIDELASAIAEERYEEHQHLLARQKQDRERAYKNNNTVSFGPSNGNWEMQRRMYKVRNMNSLMREKEKGRGDQPRRRSVRREFVTRSTEERSQRCMSKASSNTITQLLEALTAPSVRIDISRIKMRAGVAAADQAVRDLCSRFHDVPVIAQTAVWCETMSTIPGLSLVAPPEPEHDSELCSRIIMTHWRMASHSPYVTDALDVQRKKKRRPLDFLLFSIGLLYTMARGGEAVNVKLTGTLPQIIRRMPAPFVAKVERGIVVKELPDLSATLKPLKAEMLPYLARVYRNDWIFTENSVNDGIQLVKQCCESRYRGEEETFLACLRAIEASSLQHTDAEIQHQIGQCYRDYLQALVPAHSANRQWPTLTS
jgi:hypothetical protein